MIAIMFLLDYDSLGPFKLAIYYYRWVPLSCHDRSLLLDAFGLPTYHCY